MDEVERRRMPKPRTASGTAVEGGGVDKQRSIEATGEADFYSPIQYGSGGYPEVVEHVEEIRGALEAILGILGHEIFQ